MTRVKPLRKVKKKMPMGEIFPVRREENRYHISQKVNVLCGVENSILAHGGWGRWFKSDKDLGGK